MSANYLVRLFSKVMAWRWLHSRWFYAIILPAWLFVSLVLSLAVTVVVLYTASALGAPLASLNATVLAALEAAIIYITALVIALGVPWTLRRYTTSDEMGLTRLPSWADIGLAPLGFIVYFIASGILIWLAGLLFSGFDATQAQDVGFSRLSHTYEYALAFVTLIIVAPVAEELLFRGFLYGKLRGRLPAWVAIIITSLLFGLVHGQWNVGIDVFALSLILCSLREVTGSIWAGILLHILKNSVAFFIIFILPAL